MEPECPELPEVLEGEADGDAAVEEEEVVVGEADEEDEEVVVVGDAVDEEEEEDALSTTPLATAARVDVAASEATLVVSAIALPSLSTVTVTY